MQRLRSIVRGAESRAKTSDDVLSAISQPDPMC